MHRYGIEIDNFLKFDAPIEVTRLLSARRNSSWIKKIGWQNLAAQFREKFPIQEDKVNQYASKLGLDLNTDFAAVHIRRGDYIQVASLLLDEKEQFSLLKQIESCLPKTLLVMSDSPVSDDSRVILNSAFKGEVHFLDDSSIDAGIMHDSLRMASVLVTSNSTFSFSAGILSVRNGLVFGPMAFTQDEDALSPDSMFRVAGRFFLHSPIATSRQINKI